MTNVKSLLKVILSLVVISVCMINCVIAINVKNALACEHETAELKCGNGEIVHILDANYGRTTRLTCTDGPIANTTCYTENAADVVSDKCRNRQSCRVQASNSVFGDPCPATYKYLSILYECITLTDFKLSLKCERKTARLECEQGKVIRILDANYGRKSRIICPDGPVYTTNCHAKNSLPIVTDECENKRSCNILVSNSIFGNPCPNTYKYLAVRYECVRESTKSYVRDEAYGKFRTNNFRCNDGSTLRKSYVCNGIEDCSDGEDEFDCDYESVYACEGKTLNLECDRGEIIKIVNGNYGRLSTKICPKETQTRKVNCEAAHSFGALKDMCDNRQRCRVPSANSIFGDPCPDTYKYTEAHYKCVKNSADPERILRGIFGLNI